MSKKKTRLVAAILVVMVAVALNSNFARAANVTQTLALEQAIRIAMENSLQRRLAEGEVAIAGDKLAEAKSGYYPKLMLSGGYYHYNEVPPNVQLATKLAEMNNGMVDWAAYLKSTGNPTLAALGASLLSGMQTVDIPDQNLNYYGYSLVLQQPLYTGNRLTALNKQAKANQGYAKANLDAAEHSLVYEVKKAYYTVISAQQSVETMQQAVKSMEDHVKEAEAYRKVGIVAKLDVKRAEVKLADLRQKSLMAQNGLELAKMALNFTMGVDLSSNYIFVADDQYEPFELELQTCQEKALNNRPEIIAVKAKVEMAKENVEIAKSAARPLIALQAKKEDFQPYGSEPSEQIGIVASMNLLDGGLVKHQVNEAREVLKQAQTAQELISRAVLLDVQQAYQNLQLALQTITVAEKSLDQAQETVHMADVSYKAGLGTSLERIDAEVGLTQAKTNYTQALSMYHIALAQLQKAIGQ
jgi:outer membrane protein